MEELSYQFGDNGLIGQQLARERIERILASGRISHAYLFSGPSGIGKKAFALAFAEVLNGVSHLTELGEAKSSRKSSWFTHPDIHLFIPMPRKFASDELRERLELLAKDPYEIVDFSLRPSLTDSSASKNVRAFYPIDYFRENIRPAAFLKPNEGRKTVIVISNIEEMRKESANAFLKLLEEPSGNLVFLLTTDNQDALLPTIISRCQLIKMSPLKTEDIERGLIQYDGYSPEDAQYLARISGGNYALTRFYDLKSLKAIRTEVIDYMRAAFRPDVVSVVQFAQNWNSDHNLEGQIAIMNTLEVIFRDIMVYRETGNSAFITNYDQLEAIKKFSDNLPDARLEEMMLAVDELRGNLYQNVSAKLIFSVLAQRLARLMRGLESVITPNEQWKHIPAFVE